MGDIDVFDFHFHGGGAESAARIAGLLDGGAVV